MNKTTPWTIKIGWPQPLGVSRREQGVNFVIEVKKSSSCELVIYKKGTSVQVSEILLTDEYRMGNVMAVWLDNFSYENYEYTYRIDGVELLDKYSFSVEGKRSFGRWDTAVGGQLRSGFFGKEYDWEDDKRVGLALNEAVLYCMHVRGFTKHTSSKAKYKGTFRGVMEKIPYLKGLGINQVEFMPIYEFSETILEDELSHPEFRKEAGQPCINYWGYSNENYYFAVKKTYAAGEDERTEFKTLVKELHKNGMEVILEFYFSSEERLSFVAQCLSYWVLHYHVDGFHLTGCRLDYEELLREPLMADIKLYTPEFDSNKLVIEEGEGDTRQAAVCSIDYLTNMRSFLKGDSDKVKDALHFMRRNADKYGYINFFAFHDGFTMADMVSFDHKHNEANEEGGMDGWEYNFSWNCGVEGKTRKGRVLELRKRQMKNAWVMLLLSQGIPAILAGDELCNSQEGNNNAYCQDNAIGWVNWNCPKCYEELYTFIGKLIQLRKEHPIFHMLTEMKMMDEKGIGYPDVSYHSEKAWYIDYRSAMHSFGVLYCGDYAKKQDGADDYFYIAYNMDWRKQNFALPDIPKNRQWNKIVDTGREESFFDEEVVDERVLQVLPRTVVVMIGKKIQRKRKNGRKEKRD